MPPPPPPEPCCASDWYLKGFLGITGYDVDSIDTPLFDTADFTIFDTGFEGSGFAGLGLGYKFNDWLTATLKSWVSLANFYWYIGCW